MPTSMSVADAYGKVLAMIRAVPWARLFRLYGVFAVVHTCIKLFKGIYNFRRLEGALRKLPGKPTDLLGTEIVANLNRIHDWKTDLILEHPDADFVQIPEGWPTVVAASPEAVKWMLKDNFENVTKFDPGDDYGTWLFHNFIGGKGFFSLSHGTGPHHSARVRADHAIWLDQRKKTSRVFTRGRFNTLVYQAFSSKGQQFIDLLQKHLNERPNEPVDIQRLFFAYTMDASQKVFFGREANTLGGKRDIIADSFDQAHRSFIQHMFSTIVAQLVGGLLPWPLGELKMSGWSSILMRVARRIDPEYAKYSKAVSMLHREVGAVVKALRETEDEKRRMCAHSVDNGNAVDGDGEDACKENLSSIFMSTTDSSDKDIGELVMHLIIAGRDTTACLLSWLTFELTQNPGVQAKLCEEIDRVLLNGDKKAVPTSDGLECVIPTYADLEHENMPYLNGVLFEALRLHPPVPDDPKVVAVDTELPGGLGTIRAGTKILYHAYSMGRHPKRYPNPLSFNPERWIPFEKPDPFEMPTFQAGSRSCLGRDFAIFEAKLLTCLILQHFNLSLKEGEKDKISYAVALTMSVVNSGDDKQPSDQLLVHLRKRR